MSKAYADQNAKKKKKDEEQQSSIGRAVNNATQNIKKNTVQNTAKETANRVSSVTKRNQQYLNNQQKRQNEKRVQDVSKATAVRTSTTANRSSQQYIAQQRKSNVTANAQKQTEAQKQLLDEYAIQSRTSEQRRKAAQAQKSGTQTYSQAMGNKKTQLEETDERVAKNTAAIGKKAIQDVGSGHMKTIADFAEFTADHATEAKASKMGILDDKEKYAQLQKEQKQAAEEARNLRTSLQEKQEKRQAEWDERTKDVKGLEKAYYGAIESGIGMSTDIAFGPLWGLSMASRTYGNTRGQAEKEGATEAEDRRNALLQAGKEVATEYMFRGVGLAGKLSGSKSISIGQKMADNLLKNTAAGAKKEALGAGIRLLGGVGEENLEEVAGWALDPLITEYAYGRNVRRREAEAEMRVRSEELLSQIPDEETARSMGYYLASDDFIERNMKSYMEAGMSEADARDMSEKMRDYLMATLTGDTKAMAEIEDEMSKAIAGKGGLSKESWSFNELKDTIASTTLLTAATGAPGAVNTAVAGNAYQNQYGQDAVKALTDTVIQLDPDNSARAQALKDHMDEGKELAGTQVYDLLVSAQDAMQEVAKKANAAIQTAKRTVQAENLIDPVFDDENGIQLGELTDKTYDANAEEAEQIIDNYNQRNQIKIDETEKDLVADAIAAFKAGVLTPEHVYALSHNNTAAREVFKETTGIDLDQYNIVKNGTVDEAASNLNMQQNIFAQAAQNYIESARLETAEWRNTKKGEVVTSVSRRMGTNGTAALSQALSNVDEMDRAKYTMTANVADRIYHAARNSGEAWDDVKGMAKQLAPGVDEATLQNIYEAGLRDRDAAMDTARGMAVQIDEAIKSPANAMADRPVPELKIETSVVPKGSTVDVLNEMVQLTGTSITLTDSLPENVNGTYLEDTNTIVINATQDGYADRNIGYVFMHEFTHHMRIYAPEEYQALADAVRKRWEEKDPEGFKARISQIMDRYKAVVGQDLTEEQALEEVIADGAHEFLNDDAFVEQICDENPTLAKQIINSIKDVLRKLRALFGSTNDPMYKQAIFSQLDMLSEAEALWMTAYQTAVRNKAAIGLVEWDAEARERNSVPEYTQEEMDAHRQILADDMADNYGESFTSDYDESGYIYPDGQMLKMGAYGTRGDDHALAGLAYDDVGYDTYNSPKFEAQKRFINEGNFRYMPENNSLEMGTKIEPTFEQYRWIRQAARDGRLTEIEFTNTDGETVDHKYYGDYASAEEVVNDVKRFYRTGEIGGSDLSQFRYSVTEEQREDLNELGVDVTEGGTAVKYSVASWDATDVEALKQKLRQAGYEGDVIDRWVNDINTVAAIIYGDMQRLNYEADQYQKALKPNSEYFFTLDLSTLCQKRRLYQGTYNAIMHRLINVGLQPEDTIRLRRMMDDMGYEVPCGICYEESRKKNEGKFAEQWIEKYKAQKHDDPYIPTIDDVTTTDGRAKLREEHPEALESYLNYQKGRGSANPKVSFTHTDYRGDILKMTKNQIENVKHIGGLRIQSFSDFETVHVIDMMQAVMDMAAQSLTAQAYTKVPAFADIFGGTGIKINLSLIGRVDKNGVLQFDAKEGIDPDEAFRIREKYSKNVGTIIVGANRESILAAWADPRIDMVIPFHRSGWSTAEFEALGLKDYEDFQAYQAERYLDGSKNGLSLADAKKAGYMESAEELYTRDYWDNSKSGKENAERYLELCAEQKRRPVFYNFLKDNGDGTWSLQDDGSTDGYWKSLIDFKMYDNEGNPAPQELVKPNFDMEAAQQVMADYEGNADTLPVAQDVVDSFVEEYQKEHPNARYSISPSLDSDLQKVLDNEFPSSQSEVVIGNTSDFLVNVIGARPLTVTMPANKAYAAMVSEEKAKEERRYNPRYNYHNLGKKKLLAALSAAEDPIIAIVSKTDENGKRRYDRVMLVTDVLDADGNNIVVVEQVDSKGQVNKKYVDVNRTVTSFSRDYIQGLVEDGVAEDRVLDYDKKRISTIARTEERQTLNRLNSAYFKNNIDDFWANVNYEKSQGRYSLTETDSEGNELSQGQREFFKDSKVRDENGNLLVLYHGTENSGFTVFDADYGISSPRFFFVPDLEKARGYSGTHDIFNPMNMQTLDELNDYIKEIGYEDIAIQDGDEYVILEDGTDEILRNSSLSDLALEYNEYTGWGGNAANYKVYLNITNPLVVDAEGNNWDEIPYNGTTITSNELAELAYAEDYDGLIINNVLDYGLYTSSSERSPQTDVIAFSSEQIKDTRNQNPTENPDIRFSVVNEDDVFSQLAEEMNDVAEIPATDPVIEEGRIRMARSKEDFFNTVNAKWNPAWLTKGEVVKESSVYRNIRELVKATMRQSDTTAAYKNTLVQATMKDAKQAYRLMQQGKDREAADVLWKSALHMVENVDFYRDDIDFEIYKEIRDFLRGYRISIDERYYRDVDYPALRKRNFGKLLLVKDGTSVDQVYQELAEHWPSVFDAEEYTNPADQLLHIDHVLRNNLEPFRNAYTSEEAEKVAWNIASDLFDILYDGEAYQSLADKYDAIIRNMKARHAEAMLKVRQNADAKLQKVRAQEREKRMEERRREVDNRTRMKAFGHIEDNYDWLVERVLKPTKEKGILEEFRTPLAEFLLSLDLQTERSKQLEVARVLKTGTVSKKTIKMRDLKEKLLEMATRPGESTNLLDLDPNMQYIIDGLNGRINGASIDELTTQDIKDVDVLLKALRHTVDRHNKIRQNNKKLEISVMSDRFVNEMLDQVELYGQRKEGGHLDKIVNMGMLTPTYFFKRMGAMGDMYMEMRKGFDTYIRNEKMIIEEIKKIMEPYYERRITSKGEQHKPGSTIESWSTTEGAQTFELESGDSITLSVAQMMSLYCLKEREQAREHMLIGGVVASPIQIGSKMEQLTHGRKETDKTKAYKMTEADISKIIAELTPEQVQVAQKLQDLMATRMAELGNEAHREMYGYEMFEDPNYFPIHCSDDVVLTDINNAEQAIQKIKSYGAAKPTKPHASNALVLDDIFDVVADHCNGMNLYASYLVPISDFMRFYNSMGTTESGDMLSVKEALRRAYGDMAKTYVMNFMRDINGIKNTGRGGAEDLLNNILGHAKRAAVFGNVRVALQQPTAVVRALSVMDPKYFVGKDVGPSKAAMEEMFEHCPIALWKSWGFYDAYMGRDIKDVMFNNWSVSEELLAGMYGELDNRTWSWIWTAVKKEVQDTHPDVEYGSDEFWELCNERASYVFDATQVVDSTFHRSNDMRNKGVAMKMFTAFQAEPTLTFNVFRQGVVDAYDQYIKGNKDGAAKALARATAVIVGQALVVSFAQAIADAWRQKKPRLPWEDDEPIEEMTKDELIEYAQKNGIAINPKGKKAEILETIQAYEDSKYAPGWAGRFEKYAERVGRNMVVNFFDNVNLINNIEIVKDFKQFADYMFSVTAENHDWPYWLRSVMGWDDDYLFSPNNMLFNGAENIAKGYEKLSDTNKKIKEKKAAGEELTIGDYYDAYYAPVQKFGGGIGSLFGFPLSTLMRDTKPIWDLMRENMEVYAADELLSEPEKQVPTGSNVSKDVQTGVSSDEYMDIISEAQRKGLSGKEFDQYVAQQIRQTSEEKGGGVTTEYKTTKSSSSTASLASSADAEYEPENRVNMKQASMENLKASEAKALEKASGKTGKERADALWDTVGDNYTHYVTIADWEYIDEMRTFLADNGGDVDAFDAKVLDAAKSAYKKTLVDAALIPVERQQKLYNYMVQHGYSEQYISSEILYKSNTAKDLKAAFRMGNAQYIQDETNVLVQAGLTYEDWQKLYKYRNYGKSSYSGKYSDPNYQRHGTSSTGKLSWPITGEITSGFGYRGSIAGTNPNHRGIDIAGNVGDPVAAADGGTVIAVNMGYNGGYGNQVKVQHDDGTITWYNHLNGANVNVGDRVAKGDQIAQVGATGAVTGPHLDFMVEIGGEYVDPLTYLT